ncbi:hypothetical protein GC173_05225 [bacterium]|nr:hypothetical protein [bacterium]
MNRSRHSLWTMILMTVLSLLAGLAPAATPSPKPFPDGSRVVFLGDSITHLGYYLPYIQHYYQVRFPERHIEMFNAGVSAGRANDALARIEWDVLARNPTHVLINLGMNDVGTSQFIDKPAEERDAATAKFLERYRRDMTAILDRLQKEPNIEVILIIPTLYDDTGNQERVPAIGKNDAIRQCGEFLKQQGEARNIAVVDFNTPMLVINKTGQAEDPGFTIVSEDRVHPRKPGHLVATFEFLKAQGLLGPVSTTSIDAKAGTISVTGAADTTVRMGEGEMAWELLERGLPYWVDTKPESSDRPSAEPGLKWVPFQKAFNQGALRVTGLPESSWRLKIGDDEIGVYTSKELATGIDFYVGAETPQMKQAEKVMGLMERRWKIERDLRGGPWTRAKIFDPAGASMDDPAALEKALEDWRKADDYSETREKYVQQWRDSIAPGAAEKNAADIAKLTAQIAKESKPRKQTFRLVKVGS